MNKNLLQDINRKWNRYKELFHLDSPVTIEEIRFDAGKGVDCSFDVTEMFSDHFILHINKDFSVYRSEYRDFVLWHEFTHLYDFLTQPYSYNTMRKIYLYMNTYSEYHASRRALGLFMEKSRPEDINPEKPFIPAPYKDISLRDLVSTTLRQAEIAGNYFRQQPSQKAFHVYLRYIMYLMGYASHFLNAEDIVDYCLIDLQEDRDLYLTLYQIIREKDFFKILSHMDKIYEKNKIK